MRRQDENLLELDRQWPWPKWKGKLVFVVIKEDPRYVKWVFDNVISRYKLSHRALALLKERLEHKQLIESQGTSVAIVHVSKRGRIYSIHNHLTYVRETKNLPGTAYAIARGQEKQGAGTSN